MDIPFVENGVQISNAFIEDLRKMEAFFQQLHISNS